MRNISLDKMDIEILSQLQKHGRIKNVDLAEKIALSPSPCLQRVKRMEKIGLIESYHAKINLSKLTGSIQVLTQFTLSKDTLDAQQLFEKLIVEFPEVMECFMGSGGFDYMVKYQCRDIAHYQSLVQQLLDSDLDISKYHSYVVMREVVNRSEYPLKTLLLGD